MSIVVSMSLRCEEEILVAAAEIDSLVSWSSCVDRGTVMAIHLGLEIV